ncbi:MAG TPA: kelch repeat-containing protein [Candidatus Acidoferrales bacterium]|nr:kelch repeat-containing protein [Candidatus Acidoferrales bacterium]
MKRRAFLKRALGVSLGLPLAHLARALPLYGDERGPRNARVADIPDNTWMNWNIKVPKEAGGWEVPWVYDPKNRIFVHYGGCTPRYTNEEWVFDLGAERWTQRYKYQPEGVKDRPGAACSRGMAFDSRRGVIWIYGGATPMSNQNLGLWFYDAAASRWTFVNHGPQRLEANSMAYDSINDALVTLGRGGPARTWVFKIGEKRWLERRAGPQGDHGYRTMTFDPEVGRIVYFTGNLGRAGETWTYDVKADAWSRMRGEGPPARKYAGMTYDTKNKVHILFGGSGPGAWNSPPADLYNDTWVYDAKADAWTEMKPVNAPGPSKEHMMFAYDSEHNVAVLAHYQLGTWLYRYRR